MFLILVVRDLCLFSGEEDEDEESLDFRFDFLRDFFLWDFLLDLSDLTDLWLLSLSLSERLLSSLLTSRLAELCLLALAVRLLLSG